MVVVLAVTCLLEAAVFSSNLSSCTQVLIQAGNKLVMADHLAILVDMLEQDVNGETQDSGRRGQSK